MWSVFERQPLQRPVKITVFLLTSEEHAGDTVLTKLFSALDLVSVLNVILLQQKQKLKLKLKPSSSRPGVKNQYLTYDLCDAYPTERVH